MLVGVGTLGKWWSSGVGGSFVGAVGPFGFVVSFGFVGFGFGFLLFLCLLL